MKKIPFILLFVLVIPFQFSMATAVDTDVKVDIPIQELQGLLQQLDDIAQDVLGQAGIQIRQTIDELNDKVEQQIGNVKDASIEVIQEASAQLNMIIQNLVKEANKLLREVNKMIQDNVDCINKALAERIAQIKDSFVELLDAATEAIQNAVDRIYIRATQLVDTGTNRVATVLNKTTAMLIRVGFALGIFILLFWLLRSLWKFGDSKTSKGLRFAIIGIVVVLIGGLVYGIISPKIVAKIADNEVIIPKWENSCEDGDNQYDEFIQLVRRGASERELKRVGDAALESLNWCLLTSVSPERGRGTADRIEEISAVLYPPPPAPSSSGASDVAVTCGSSGNRPGKGIAPGWVSKYDLGKLAVIEDLRNKNIKIKDYNKLIPRTATANTKLLNIYLKDVNTKVYTNNQVIKPKAVIDNRTMNLKYKDVSNIVKMNKLNLRR